jgi:hypothetical protein
MNGVYECGYFKALRKQLPFFAPENVQGPGQN